ncbi:hypothetical protein ACROYT_G033482 [Oculina patagonica]
MDDPEATYKFPEYFGTEYKGGIEDGMFQGEGKLIFPGSRSCVYYTGRFDKGKAVGGYFEFADGLRVELENWEYCDGDLDRLFKSEEENGLKPAGRSQLTDQDPPPTIPEGMYDCGDGFYDPVKRKIVNHDLVFLRNTDEKEHNWIVNRCRKAWDEPVGKRKIH